MTCVIVRCSTLRLGRGRRWSGQFHRTSGVSPRRRTTTESSSSVPTSAACSTRRPTTGRPAVVRVPGPGSATSAWSWTTGGCTCWEAGDTATDSTSQLTRWRALNWRSSVATGDRLTGDHTPACRDPVSSRHAVCSVFRQNSEAAGDSLTYVLSRPFTCRGAAVGFLQQCFYRGESAPSLQSGFDDNLWALLNPEEL